MNSKVKSGLGFGIVLAVVNIIENLLFKDNPTTKDILISILTGLFAGAIAGFLFGWLMGKFESSKFVNKATKIELDTDEKLIFQTSANHFKGIEPVGGKLYLTDKRLIFKSHKLNIQNHELTINLSDITEVQKNKTLRLINNGLVIKTTQRMTEKFVVDLDEVDKWLSELDTTQKSLQH